MVGVAAIALAGCLLMLAILKYGRNTKFGMKGRHITSTVEKRTRSRSMKKELLLLKADLFVV